MQIDNEIWKDLVGYENFYQVSNFGQIRSKDRIITMKNGVTRTYKSKIIKQRKNNRKYHIVDLYNETTKTTSLLHRLVAKTFIKNPEGKNQINHIDGNKSNNHTSNLEWNTQSENMLHSYRENIRKPSKVTDIQRLKHSILMKSRPDITKMNSKKICKIDPITNNVIETYESVAECARKNINCNKNSLARICRGEVSANHIYKNFIWKYI